ncbi:MAG: leucyl/phenylalanyl-tRNA--protein transferase [Phycisphaeraceae bacterium]|nr:leucyl/phenylalanyl-tRNA--protein transferase [Phycisphaerales bacterium]MCB9843972.1 leucyl/phenylalanyl-tRNA--protein transferase [Phycisphaeraceae bacterium]
MHAPAPIRLADIARADPAFFVRQMRDLYAAGFFPMADPHTDEINFYAADPRGFLPLTTADGFRIPATVQRDIRSRRFTITADTAFEPVMRQCAGPRRESPSNQSDSTWINEDLIAAYAVLHNHNMAHSVEAWRNDPESNTPVLVGGIYGISLNHAFFAESMFHVPRPRRPDSARHPLDGSGASSVCLVALIQHLARCGYHFCDTQVITPHVARFGAQSITRDKFDAMLARAVRRETPDLFNRVPFTPITTNA